MTKDFVLLQYILEASARVREFTDNSRQNYFQDRKTQSAVLRELQTISESCQRLSAEAKSLHPEIFWQGISGFRNVLVHNYLGIDHERVWAVVETELPLLERAVSDLLKREFNQ